MCAVSLSWPGWARNYRFTVTLFVQVVKYNLSPVGGGGGAMSGKWKRHMNVKFEF